MFWLIADLTTRPFTLSSSLRLLPEEDHVTWLKAHKQNGLCSRIILVRWFWRSVFNLKLLPSSKNTHQLCFLCYFLYQWWFHSETVTANKHRAASSKALKFCLIPARGKDRDIQKVSVLLFHCICCYHMQATYQKRQLVVVVQVMSTWWQPSNTNRRHKLVALREEMKGKAAELITVQLLWTSLQSELFVFLTNLF